MKMKLNLLAAGIFLAAVSIGFGQSTLQFTVTSCTVVESDAAVAINVQRLNDTETIVSVDYATADGTATNGLPGRWPSAPAKPTRPLQCRS
jgi:hypothetical protein